jgi:Skp family chaperone for outer membrane proteins
MSKGVEISFLKNLKYAVIGVILGALLGLATTTTMEQEKIKINLPSLLFSSATGFITGLLFSLLQAYEEELSAYQKKLEEIQVELKNTKNSMESCNSLYLESLQHSQNSYQSKVDNLDRLINEHENKLLESYDILDRAKNSFDYYSKIQNLLGSNKIERELIKCFLDKVINQPDYITRSSIIDFHKLLILGLQKCTVWRGIHQGSIRNLGFAPLDDSGETYFQILRNHQIQDKKRIIILNQDEQEDLKRKDIMQAFWDKTGKDVPSYWISQDSFYNFTHLQRSVQIHDCALHNDKVLLHYHRNYHLISDPNIPEGLIMIDFGESKSAVWRAVVSIFAELENPSYAIHLRQITKEDIDNLPDN